MTKSERKKFIEKTFSGTEVGVLIEDFNDQVKLVGEQYKGFKKEFKDFRGEMYGFREDMYGFREETSTNFKLVMKHLSKIEDDFLDLRRRIERLDKDKVSVKEFNWLKNKVLEIEDRLEKYKNHQAALAAKN